MNQPTNLLKVPDTVENFQSGGLKEIDESSSFQDRRKPEYRRLADHELAGVVAENRRLHALVDAQRQLHHLEMHNALNVRLGNILIQAVDSPSTLLSVPGKLLGIWRQSIRKNPPAALGGKGFGKVIFTYEEEGFAAVEKLLARISVSPVMQANAWTALSRHLIQNKRDQAAEAARRAYALDPKPYRLKWLAFRLHEAGDVIEAAAMLELLPAGTPFSGSEARQAGRLQKEAKLAREPGRELEKLKQYPAEKALRVLQQCSWFNTTWYLTQYPEVKESGADPVEHYFYQGANEGKNPGPFFDTSRYLEQHPDISENDLNPLLHYVEIGFYEGLRADPCNKWLKLFDKQITDLGKIGNTAGHEKYTVVSAVYNVAAYLDDFFYSMICQTLDFRSHIYLVMVDDGSTDHSAEIIRRWQASYPENILYLHKENGGQASARNLGMQQVHTEWVTFIDPDDFVAPDYFQKVDDFLAQQAAKKTAEKLALLSCNFIFYRENQDGFSDTHPLKYRFAKGDRIFAADNLEKHLQLSVAHAFFRLSLLQEQNRLFDERIKPNFEDGHFVGCYLQPLKSKQVAFLAAPRYYYRNLTDANSILDINGQKEECFDEVLVYGYQALFDTYITQGYNVPKYVQRTVLYHLIWYLRKIVNRSETVAFLIPSQRERFLAHLDKLFSVITTDTILEFELAGCWFFHKVGILSAFKQLKPPFQIVYVESFDWAKQQVLLRYYYSEPPAEEFVIGRQAVMPAFKKNTVHDFLERTFVQERRIWLLLSQKGKLEVRLDGVAARISIGGKQVGKAIDVQAIREHFSALQPVRTGKYAGAWLFMDRDTQADDNAEHLYRYVRHRMPGLPAYFLLREESHDWPRLQAEGFKLIAFGSAEHRLAMQECAKVVSSQAAPYVVDPFIDGGIKRRQFVFLQHGVTKDDLSRWLNSRRIDLLITASPTEQVSFAKDGNRYKFTSKEVILSGFPRHDALLRGDKQKEKLILIMPTWRKYLLGELIDKSSQRILCEGFMDTLYARSWGGLLSDPAFIASAQQQGYRIVFFPHANIQSYLDQFDLPNDIEVLSHMDGSMQTLFQRAALLITDYSSVAFETAYLKRPVVYWQFDEEEFFSGVHSYQKGYFDYRRDGFGPVCTEKQEVLTAVADLLARNCQPSSKYAERMHNTFAWRDGQCCERVLQAILALDHPAEQPEDLGIFQRIRANLRRLITGRLPDTAGDTVSSSNG
ncbi:MAG: CDP-glycerol glycerophosphotransferase family protein [Burkholderiales bacterium]|nr:CDP-glycerol glycerophosphotransferase family protein [Burkholderiales bacterium]